MSKKWLEMSHEKRAHLFPTFWYWESVQWVGKKIGGEPGIYGNYYHNHEMSYFTENTGFTRVGEKILEELKDNNLIEKIEACNNVEIPKLIELSEWFVKNNLAEKTGEQLLRQYDLVHEQFMKVMEYSLMGTVMEFEKPLLSNYLEDFLQKKVKYQSKIAEYFNVLTSSSLLMTSQKEEIALRELKIKELHNSLLDNDLQHHLDQYSYLFFGYDGPGLSKIELTKRLAGLSSDITFLKSEILTIQNTPEEVKNKKIQTVKEINLTEQEKSLFEVLSVLGYWKFERKLANQKSHALMEKFFEEIMRRHQLSKPQAKMILPSEMKEVLIEEKIDEKILNERIKLSVAIFEGFKSPRLLIGEEAKTWEAEFNASLAVNTNIKEFTGACAYPGQAKGLVKRVDDESEMEKFNQGDILVSTSTTPKLIPIMKKAGAIVTDSGGITSHAAIVARELKVPCVIGTKIGTRILKDDDKIEVDATNGIIKKL